MSAGVACRGDGEVGRGRAAVPPPPAAVWGLPLHPVDLAGAVEAVDALIAAEEPGYFITANLNYAMLSDREPDLSAINEGASYIFADGMPLVWASRWNGSPLPARVAGSDLIFELCAMAARRSYRVALLGGAPGVAEAAAARLSGRYEGLQVVTIPAPDIRRMSDDEAESLLARIREASADLLLAALGQPLGERWLARNLGALGVRACAQVGASIDFAAGRVRRAPTVLQRTGFEWAFRLMLEPRRLGGRYLGNAAFLARMAARDASSALKRRRGGR